MGNPCHVIARQQRVVCDAPDTSGSHHLMPNLHPFNSTQDLVAVMVGAD